MLRFFLRSHVPIHQLARIHAIILIGLLSGCTIERDDLAKAPWFEDVAQSNGLTFKHDPGATDERLLPEIMGSGVALLDVENDGDLDLYLIQNGGRLKDAQRSGNELFLNDGNGNFLRSDGGLSDTGYGMGVATGDYDNDGYVDIYVTNVGANQLYRNNGDGSFHNVTTEADVADSGFGTAALFGDFDTDGDLDLFSVNYVAWDYSIERPCFDYDTGIRNYCDPGNYDAPTHDVLYRNNGDGTFSDITLSAGIASAKGNGLGAVSADFNGDGQLDIYVANDKTPNHLWINQGNMHFVEEGFKRGAAIDDHGIAKAGMGVVARDIDLDNDVDLIVVNIQGETDSYYRNDGAYFSDVSAQVGLTRFSRSFTRFGVALTDFDHDGRLDFYEANGRVTFATESISSDPYAEPNTLFTGSIGLPFKYVQPAEIQKGSLAVHTSRAVAAGDIDNDGKIDLVVTNRDAPVYLLRNVTKEYGTWLSVELLTQAGAPALHAQLQLKTDLGHYHTSVQVAGSYLAANSPAIHLTFPTEPVIVQASVRWADGAEQRVDFLPLNQKSVITRAESSTSLN